MFKERYSNEINRALKWLGVTRVCRDSVEFKWGWFAPRPGFELMFNRGGYFDQTCSFDLCIFWGKLNIKTPFKTKIPESCDTPNYGIQIHNNTFWLHLGGKMNSWEQCDSKWITWDLPIFSWVFDWHKIQLPDGNLAKYTYEDRSKARTESHPYKYKLNSGVTQETMATCFIEERQWHRKWLPFIKMNKRVIDITFNDEVGERSGSWKGGTTGCSYDVKGKETMLECLRRMESERKFK